MLPSSVPSPNFKFLQFQISSTLNFFSFKFLQLKIFQFQIFSALIFFSFNFLQLQISTSIFNFRLDFKLQLQTSNLNFNFTHHLQTSTLNFSLTSYINVTLNLQTTISICIFILQLQILTSFPAKARLVLTQP